MKLDHVAMGRLGQPIEVARLIEFLLSDASSYVRALRAVRDRDRSQALDLNVKRSIMYTDRWVDDWNMPID